MAEQERLIELLKEKRQAVISHAVTKGLNPDVPMKDSGIEWLGEIPVHWALARVKTVSTFTTSGPRGWSERISDEGHVFIQSGDLDDDRGRVRHRQSMTVSDDARRQPDPAGRRRRGGLHYRGEDRQRGRVCVRR